MHQCRHNKLCPTASRLDSSHHVGTWASPAWLGQGWLHAVLYSELKCQVSGAHGFSLFCRKGLMDLYCA